jgi:uncharacterized protein (TIGR02145 family)
MKKDKLFLLFFASSFYLIFFSCKPKSLPLVDTTGATNVGFDKATFFGSLAGKDITVKGFCWDTIINPDLTKQTIELESGSKNFSATATNLKSGRKYYVRAYASNSEGTAFGDNKFVFTTNIPIVTTNSAIIQSYSFAILSGNIQPKGSSVVESGVCYDTLPNVTVSKSKLSSSNSNSMSLTFTNNIQKRVYYFKAYATFNFGTVYGAENTFTLGPKVYNEFGKVKDWEGNEYKTVKIGTKTWMAENLRSTYFNDGTAITNKAAGQPFGSFNQPAYGYYNNYINNLSEGALYNAYAANSSNLAPLGWHVASIEDWNELKTTIETANNGISAFQQLTQSYLWVGSNCIFRNWTNMKLDPLGYRSWITSPYDDGRGYSAYFWTSSNTGANNYYITLSYCNFISLSDLYPSNGLYVRCVKD